MSGISETSWWFALMRAIHFASCLLMFSICGFDRIVAAPVARGDARAGGAWDRIARRLYWPALLAALISGVGWFVCVASAMSGLSIREAMRDDVLRVVWSQTHFGVIWQVRLICWILAVIVFLLKWRGGALLFSGLLLAGLAWAGHGETGHPQIPHLIADLLHLLTCGIWPAGLLPLALLWMNIRRHDSPQRWESLGLLCRRFSNTSIASVIVLGASGVVNGWILVGSARNLLVTLYGRVLLLKIALFVVMVGFGAVNLLVLKPRLTAGDRLDSQQLEAAAGRLQFNVVMETVLGAAILAIVGVLGLLPP